MEIMIIIIYYDSAWGLFGNQSPIALNNIYKGLCPQNYL